ncbi:MAG: phosphoribosylamine--glycine ligase [Bacteroidales bacterium]|nr:phosphoribosylamine--glycine ligase [Bacteroidales bacterium]
MNILLLGSGGREHAIAYKISQSAKCNKLFIAPGNAGTSNCGTNVNLKNDDFEAIKRFVLDNSINMLVVGPEAPLVAGIADFFKNDAELKNVAVIGPSKLGATLEGSKDFAKHFMQKNNIPTARYETFTKDTIAQAVSFLHTLKPPYVLKADGLAAGKGVLILDTLEQAETELHNMLENAKFGDASSKVVIEEFLKGIELSVFVLTDGKDYKILPSAKDYKRIGEHDTGLNTGGMGSVSPVPFANDEFMQKVEQRIVIPTVAGLQKDNIDYCGFIFIGLMNVSGDPYVIEYNVRMGDPETESVFPRIESDVVELFQHAADGTLSKAQLTINPQTAACVMMVAQGYPESYRKGDVISGIADVTESLVFHAGTKLTDNGDILTNGGRVICVTSFADNLPQALEKSYRSVEKIKWDGKYFRRDIGKDLMEY